MKFNKKKINKKGTIFGIFLVVGTLIIVGTTIFSFYSAKDKLIIDLDSPKYLYQLNSIKENFLEFEEQSAKFAVQSTIYKTLKNVNSAFPRDCLAYGNSIILTKTCSPDNNELKKSFIESFNLDFQKLIEDSPVLYIEQKTKKEKTKSEYKLSPNFETLIEGNILKIGYEKQEISLIRKTEFINYEYNIELPKEQEINLADYRIYLDEIGKDIENLYDKTNNCKKNEDINSIKACLNELSLKNFEIDAKKEGEYILLTLKTKNKFFYADNNNQIFDKILINFAVNAQI